jgi:hypothetical protein
MANALTQQSFPHPDGTWREYYYDSTPQGVVLYSIDPSTGIRYNDSLSNWAREQGLTSEYVQSKLGGSTGSTQTDGGSYGGGTVGPSAEELAARNAKHKQNLAQIEQAYQNGLMTYNEKIAAQEDARNQLIGQKQSGLESNSAYFSAVSPDAFQSQMGNYNQKVLDAYQQGEKTLENNQKSIDYFKDVNAQNYQADLAGENTFNASTGEYSGAFNYAPKTIAAPTFNAVTQNPYDQAAKLGVPSWAPNYGGMSVQQKAKDETDPIKKYLG